MGITINNESTTTEPTPSNGQQPQTLGGLNAFYCCQIFALGSALLRHINVKLANSHLLQYSIMEKQSNRIGETKKRAHDSQKVRAKENLKLSHGGPSYNQASGTNPPIKTLR